MDIERFIPERIKRIPTFMDFEGQKKAERSFQAIIMVFAVVGFAWGYICQQFSQTMYILIAGFVISCLIQKAIMANAQVETQFVRNKFGGQSLVVGGYRFMLTLPPWPIYRQNPVAWLKPRPQAEDIGSASVTPAPSSSQKTKKKKN